MSIKAIQKKLDKRLISASLSAGDALGETRNSSKRAAVGTALMVPAAMSAMQVFASGTIESGVKDGLGKAYGVMKALAVPIAAIGVALSAFFIFTDSERGMDKAKKTILYTIIGLAIVLLGPGIVNQISEWFGTSESDAVFS